ncbi:unnamed protein product [Effrenium voratum]|nr:unnamed protein product [Effrenium voratum]
MAGSLLADISRLGPSNAFSDVVLAASGGHSREANSVILAARSKVFQRMLSSPMLEGHKNDKGLRLVQLPEVSPDLLDQLVEWCYCDEVKVSDCFGAMDLLAAADCFEIPGLLHRCGQKLAKLLTPQVLPEALDLAQRLNSQELWRTLAPVAARELPPASASLPAPLGALVWAERRKALERQAAELRLRLANVPAPRPGIVFWRQQLPQELQRELLREALEEQSEEAVPAMLAGLKERAAGLFRAQCAARWKALPEETRSLCERCAQEDQEKFEQSKAHLEEQLQEIMSQAGASQIQNLPL